MFRPGDGTRGDPVAAANLLGHGGARRERRRRRRPHPAGGGAGGNAASTAPGSRKAFIPVLRHAAELEEATADA